MRRLERETPAVTLNTFASIYVAPAATKSELVDVCVFGDAAHAYIHYFYLYDGTTFTYLDEIHVTNPVAIEHRSYNGIVLYPGDHLYHFAATTGTFTAQVYLGMVQVSPV